MAVNTITKEMILRPKDLDEARFVLECINKDPMLLIEACFQVRPKDKSQGKSVPFMFNIGQQYAYDCMQRLRRRGKPVRILILKARQLGMSTLATALQLVKAVTASGTECFTISLNKEGSAAKFLDQIKYHHAQLPKWLQPMYRNNTKTFIHFANPDDKKRLKDPGLDSKIYTDSGENENACRSHTVDHAHLTEFAMWPSAEKTLLSITNAVADVPDTSITIETTANGAQGHFYEMWQDADTDMSQGGDAEWYPLFIPFWVHEEYEDKNLTPYDEAKIIESLKDYEKNWMGLYGLTLGQISWMRRTIKTKCSGSLTLFLQEYAPNAEDCFLLQGETVFAKDRIRQLASKIEYEYAAGMVGSLDRSGRRPVFKQDAKGPLTIWEQPKSGAVYLIGADPCGAQAEVMNLVAEVDRKKAERTLKLDYATIQVIKVLPNEEYEQVAEYQYRTAPETLAYEVAALGQIYNTALVMPEASLGGTLVHKLKQIYPFIGYYDRADRRGLKVSGFLGFDTNRKSKEVLLQRLLSTINEGAIKIRSRKLIKEMTTFIRMKDGKRMAAASGAHDDLLMAMGLALMGADQTSTEINKVSYAEGSDDFSDNGLVYGDFGAIAKSFNGGSRGRSRSDSDGWMCL